MTDNIKKIPQIPLLHDIPFNQEDKDLIVQLSLQGVIASLHNDPKYGLFLSIKKPIRGMLSVQILIEKATHGNLKKSILDSCKNAPEQLSKMRDVKYLDSLINNIENFHFIRKYDEPYFKENIQPLLNNHAETEKIDNKINQYESDTGKKIDLTKPDFQKRLNEIRKIQRRKIHFQCNLIRIANSI
jgi:hypothetical protein